MLDLNKIGSCHQFWRYHSVFQIALDIFQGKT